MKKFYLQIENCDYESESIEPLEKVLFDWFDGEGYDNINHLAVPYENLTQEQKDFLTEETDHSRVIHFYSDEDGLLGYIFEI